LPKLREKFENTKGSPIKYSKIGKYIVDRFFWRVKKTVPVQGLFLFYYLCWQEYDFTG
jgi:hypothetical protein